MMKFQQKSLGCLFKKETCDAKMKGIFLESFSTFLPSLTGHLVQSLLKPYPWWLVTHPTIIHPSDIPDSVIPRFKPDASTSSSTDPDVAAFQGTYIKIDKQHSMVN